MQAFIVDLAGVHDAESLHDALAAQLPLPAHYGRNLDAFYDVLTEYGANWRIVFRHAGAAAAGLRQVCADAAAQMRCFRFQRAAEHAAVHSPAAGYTFQ